MMAKQRTTTVGHSFPRMEAHAKVTGRTEYIYNLRLPAMLHAKMLRSPISHGRIRSIDVSAALEVPGVHHVVTGEDIRKVLPEPYYGPAFHDQPILALDKVRHFGEPVAAVLAPNPHVAEAAAQLIVVDYEELPAVFDEIEALSGDVIVHEVLKPAGTFADLKHLAGKRDTNVALDFHLRHGDADKAFDGAAHVFDHTFRTQQTMHTPFEPMVAVADVRNDRATIYSSTQGPSFVRYELARLLGWPESDVRVKTAHLGGGFGAKVYVKVEALAMALSLIAHRPVRVALTMEEQFYTITKHPSTFRIQSAVDTDGKIVGRKCEVWWNGGAYADIGPRVTQKSGFTAAGPYDIDNVAIDSFALYTNRPPAGALRGFGIPQLVWAYESHTDIIARALGKDPVAFRKQNILRNGRPQAVGTVVVDGEFEGVLDGVAKRMDWNRPFDKGSGTKLRGRGVALGFKASISPTTSSAIVAVNADGSCILYCSTVDMGQGSDTAMAQIASEVLDIPLDRIRVVNPDTDVTPYDMSTLGSRSTFHMGHAVRLAASDARDKLKAMAEEVGMPEGSNAPLPEIFVRKFGMRAGTIVGTANYKPDYAPPNYDTGQSPNATPFWMIGATGAEVEVDTETGQLHILRLVNVCDIGTPINPVVVETQISGAAVMQLGFTITENMIIENGQLANPSLADYKIPGIFDMPDIMENGYIDAVQENGPFGAKGAGESGTFGVSPAIANAIEDAVGVRITEMPITAEAIFRALRAKEGRPLEDN
jgi:CO/xanthine dehydrogenase Mo-binding subunit